MQRLPLLGWLARHRVGIQALLEFGDEVVVGLVGRWRRNFNIRRRRSGRLHGLGRLLLLAVHAATVAPASKATEITSTASDAWRKRALTSMSREACRAILISVSRSFSWVNPSSARR